MVEAAISKPIRSLECFHSKIHKHIFQDAKCIFKVLLQLLMCIMSAFIRRLILILFLTSWQPMSQSWQSIETFSPCGFAKSTAFAGLCGCPIRNKQECFWLPRLRSPRCLFSCSHVIFTSLCVKA